MNLYTVTAPLTIRYPDGQRKIMIEKFRHREGLLFFEPFWHINGLDSSVHLIRGELSGDGPWKIADHIITVTACHGTDPEMASQLTEWQSFLSMPEQHYPSEDEIRYLAQKLGCTI
jgi:hypothetical protein